MARLNYFEPFQSKSSWHEDQLTRALLVVLRYSPSALLMFYDLISKNRVNLPSISTIEFENIQFDTQKTNIENYLANKVLSVVITDKEFETKQEVVDSSRSARYDGLIHFSKELLVLIENKPRSQDVWEDQLNPRLGNQSTEVELLRDPSVIEWKRIIKILNSLISFNSISGSERMIISDFLDYVNRHFSFLNPYDNLALCKADYYLIYQRLKSILEQISKSGEVIYQPKWKTFYLETGLQEKRMVIFGIDRLESDNKYNINISLYFADTQNQARKFYENKIPYKKILELESLNWKSWPNFHISFMQTKIIGFKTAESYKNYYEYWLHHENEIYQRKKEELHEYLQKLTNLGIIEIDSAKQNELNDNVLKTSRDRLNLCPGFVLSYSINSSNAIETDKKNELANLIKKKVEEGLSILEKDLLFLK